MSRERLPERRAAEVSDFEHGGRLETLCHALRGRNIGPLGVALEALRA